MPIGVGLGLLLGSVIGGGATVAAGAIGSKANKNATQAQLDATDKSIAYQREQDAEAKREWEQTQDENRRRWAIEADREQRRYEQEALVDRWKSQQDVETYNQRRQMRQPYVDVGTSSVQALGRQAGLQVTPTSPPTLEGPPPVAGPALSELARLDQDKARAAAAAAQGARP